MGIKGVYGEIGPGTRTALLKLAIEKKEQDDRNLRIAIDFSIWQHQVQLGKGGTNADLRTLFYRSLRLLRLSIEPLFVFDGPHKPPFKRNKKTSQSGGSALQLAAIELFKLLGFPYITAPGEAEAECALLQKEGLVDAVLSEDVDTLMFGCTTHLRSWGPEDPKSKGGATHVDVYKANEIKSGASGLDRDGMVLIALMSGGDYLPAGIPNCGIKTACEAARAGFGSDLARIDRKDAPALQAWRDKLQHELRTNESKYFRTKHRTLEIPEDFPNKAVLYYYSNPVVSTSQQLDKYRREIEWREPDVKKFWQASRTFFDWEGPEGLRHYIRNMAPVMVGWHLANGGLKSRSCTIVEAQSAGERGLIKAIHGRRNHSSTDGILELRVSYIPQEVLGIGLEDIGESETSNHQTHTAVYDALEEDTSESKDVAGVSPTKRRVVAPYDPTKIERDWFPELHLRTAIPITYTEWEAEENDPKKFASRKARARRKEKEVMTQGAIERYFPKTKIQSDIPDSRTSPLGKSSNLSGNQHVSSDLFPVSDNSLTSLVSPASLPVASKRQTLQRPKSSIAKTHQKSASLIGHTRVTKPNSERFERMPPAILKETINEGEFLEMDFLLSQTSYASSKHARSPSPAKSSVIDDQSASHNNVKKADTQNDRPCKKTVTAGHMEVAPMFTITALTEKGLSSSDKGSEQVYSSIEIDQPSTSYSPTAQPTKRRSPFTRTISAPTQQPKFNPRPTYNPWKSIDDFDTSFDSLKTPLKKSSFVVDLTLS